MAITLTEKFAPYTDEQFKNESKRSLVTNQDFDWTGAHTIKVYKIQTSELARQAIISAATVLLPI